MGKKLIINLAVLVVLVLAGVKVYLDIQNDLEIVEKFQAIENREDLEELQHICEDKQYFAPTCAIANISIRINDGESIAASECDTIQYAGTPYYGIFQKREWEEKVNAHRDECIERVDSQEVIILDMEI